MMQFRSPQMNPMLRPIAPAQMPSLTDPMQQQGQQPQQAPSLTNPAGGDDDSMGNKFMQFLKMLGGHFGG